MKVTLGRTGGRLVIRFVGDYIGYRINWHPAELHRWPTGWMEAEVGTTGRYVRINLDQAYFIEELPL